MFRFNSAERLRALFAFAYPKPLFRPDALLRSLSSGNAGLDRKTLPPELSRSVVRLTCESRGKSCDICLIGTDPNSPESYEEFGAVVNTLKPEVVFMGSSPKHALEFNPVVMKKFVCEPWTFDDKVILFALFAMRYITIHYHVKDQ